MFFLSQESLDKLATLFNFNATVPSEQCKEYTKGEILFTVWLDREVTILYITNHHPGNPSSGLL